MPDEAVPRPTSIGADLSRRRLEVRARRLEHVIAALRRRESVGEGRVPPPVRQTISGFADELSSVRRQLGR